MTLAIVNAIFFIVIFVVLLDGARLMLQDSQKRYQLRKKLRKEQSND